MAKLLTFFSILTDLELKLLFGSFISSLFIKLLNFLFDIFFSLFISSSFLFSPLKVRFTTFFWGLIIFELKLLLHS